MNGNWKSWGKKALTQQSDEPGGQGLGIYSKSRVRPHVTIFLVNPCPWISLHNASFLRPLPPIKQAQHKQPWYFCDCQKIWEMWRLECRVTSDDSLCHKLQMRILGQWITRPPLQPDMRNISARLQKSQMATSASATTGSTLSSMDSAVDS